MVRTKKRKKVRKNTRVFRCVQKVKKTRKIGAAIAICQSSTKQNYRTGRRLKNKKTKKGGTRGRRKRKQKGGERKCGNWLKINEIGEHDICVICGESCLFPRSADETVYMLNCCKDAITNEGYVAHTRCIRDRCKEGDLSCPGGACDTGIGEACSKMETHYNPVEYIATPAPITQNFGLQYYDPNERMGPGAAMIPGGGGGNRRSKKGGNKSKKIKSLTKIFQQYPDIFPSGYFRFLGARLQNHIDKKTLWYKNGVILTWIKYQKTVKKTPKCIIKPGDVKLDQIVNKNQGNGAGKKVLSQFLRKFEKNRIWLEVRANNKRAIRFYRDRGFKKVCNIKFGEIPGIMMVKN